MHQQLYNRIYIHIYTAIIKEMIRRISYIPKHYPTLVDSITYIHGYIGVITVLMTGTIRCLYTHINRLIVIRTHILIAYYLHIIYSYERNNRYMNK